MALLKVGNSFLKVGSNQKSILVVREDYPESAYDFDMANIKQLFPNANENQGITLGAEISPSQNMVVNSYSWIGHSENPYDWNPAIGIYETDMTIDTPYTSNLTKLWGSTSQSYMTVTQNVMELNGKSWDKITVNLPSSVTLEAGKDYMFFTRKNRYATSEGHAEDVYVVPSKTQRAFIYFGWSIPDQNLIMDGPATMPAIYLELNGEPFYK